MNEERVKQLLELAMQDHPGALTELFTQLFVDLNRIANALELIARAGEASTEPRPNPTWGDK